MSEHVRNFKEPQVVIGTVLGYCPRDLERTHYKSPAVGDQNKTKKISETSNLSKAVKFVRYLKELGFLHTKPSKNPCR